MRILVKSYSDALEEVYVELLEIENLLPNAEEDSELHKKFRQAVTDVLLILDRARQEGV
jgi:hypothetical protein